MLPPTLSVWARQPPRYLYLPTYRKSCRVDEWFMRCLTLPGMYEMLPCGRILEVGTGRYMYTKVCYATLLTWNAPTRLFESLIGGGGGGQEGRELANMRSGNVPKVGSMDARGGEFTTYLALWVTIGSWTMMPSWQWCQNFYPTLGTEY